MTDAAARPGSALGAVLRAPFSAWAWLATSYLALSAVIGTVTFTVLVTLVTLSAGLMVLALIGLVVLWIAFGLSRRVARLETRRAATFLGRRIALRPLPEIDGWLPARMWARTKTRGAWLELLYAGLVLPVAGWVGGVVVWAVWGGALGFLLFPAYGWATASPGTLPGWNLGYPASVTVHVVAGFALLLAAPWLARGIALGQVALARMLLAPGKQEALTTRVETLQDTRSRMVAAADSERRRIERDLHDGAQQRLVALAMTLGRARTRLGDDPETARALVDEAHGEAKQALAELRDLARGIHPSVLTDRGLDAALSALAARCPVPVEVRVDVPRRAAAGIEAVAYFVVAEALTNVTKHSAAHRARVDAVRRGDVLQLTITDDGRGGADLATGSGLAGLRDRVRAVDGTFVLTSPTGGPTTIGVELPCES
jgi:signal transduction histidine kinase